MSFSDYMEHHLLDTMFTDFTVYVAYGTAATESSFTEPTGNGYAREAFGSYTLTSLPGDSQNVTNDADITFDIATGNQGTITHFALYDALTSGNLLMVISLADLSLSSIAVTTGVNIEIPAGDLTVEID